MISNAALEEAVLCLLCFSDDRAVELALKVDPNLFTNRANQTIAHTAVEYITKYNAPPKMQLEYLLEGDLRRGEGGKLLGQTLDILKEQIQHLDTKFVLEQLDRFLEIQRLSAGVQEAADALQNGELELAQKAIYKATSEVKKEESGIWFNDPQGMLSSLEQTEEHDFFSSGIDVLDEMGIRPERKTLTALMASAGKGKSWWLTEVAKRGIQHHHNVLIITLELSKEKYAFRLLQCAFALTKRAAMEIGTTYFGRDLNGQIQFEFDKVHRPSVLEKKKDIAKVLSSAKSWGRCLIKEFPTSTLTYEHLAMYLDMLERKEGFRPDLLCLDYPDLMYLDTATLRLDTGMLYRRLRGLAGQKNMAMCVVTQSNREGDSARIVGRKNVSEDWSKIPTCDNFLTYSQTKQEHQRGLARIYCAKARDSEYDQFMVLLSQAYQIGQFALDSVFMTGDVIEETKKLVGEDD